MNKDYYKLGLEISSMPLPDRDQMVETVNQSITQNTNKEIERIKLKADLKMKALADVEAEIEKDQDEGISDYVHLVSYLRGILYMLISLFLMVGEYLLVRLTLAPLEIGAGKDIVAAVVTMGTPAAIDTYLYYARLNFPQSHKKSLLTVTFFSSVCFLSVICLLATVRSDLFRVMASAGAGSAETQLSGITAFQNASHTPFLFAMLFVAVGAAFGSAVCLHEGTERIQRYLTSRPYKKKKAQGLRHELSACASDIGMVEARAKDYLLEFQKGLAVGKREVKTEIPENTSKAKFSWENSFELLYSPLTLILVVVFLLLFLAISHSAEIIVLPDLSKSSLPKGEFDGQTEFEKNRVAIRQLLLGLAPGDSVIVVGIACASFSNPEILLKGKIPSKEGYFKENTLREKVNLSHKWESLRIQAGANCTDIFGGLVLASKLFSSASGRKLTIFSDMRHVTPEFDLETPQFIRKQVIEQVAGKGLIPDLKGVEVHILGVHSFGKSLTYYESLKDFWLEYFKKAGATVKQYSIGREIVQ